ESDAEKFIAQHVCSIHRPLWHGIDQARSVDKFRLPRSDYINEIGQLLGNRRQIGIEDHQNIPSRRVESCPDVSRLTNSRPVLETNIFFRIERLYPQHFFSRAIGRSIVAENYLHLTR